MALDENVTQNEAGHIAAHAVMKAEYDAAGATPALPEWTTSSTASDHAAIHNLLHARHNALGAATTLPTNLNAASSGLLAYETALNKAYNLRQAPVAPTRVQMGRPAVGFGSVATPQTTPTFDVQNGDLLTVWGFTPLPGEVLTTPTFTGTGSVTLQQSVVGLTGYGNMYLWTIAVTAAASARTISVTMSGGTGGSPWSFIYTQWRNHGGVGVSGKANASGAPSLTLTTSANSAVESGSVDWVPVNGSTRTWRTINGAAETEAYYEFLNPYYTVYQGYKADVGAAGSETLGLSAPAGQAYSIVGVEILAGTAAATPPQPPVQTGANVFFAKSSAAAASVKKVFAHYFAPDPRSVDNLTPKALGGTGDYWDNQWLKVSGQSGSNAAYGGWMRDRPFPRAPISGDYQLADCKFEIQAAQAMGFDGFFVNIMSLSGGNWDMYKKMADAAVALGTGFYVVPMIDTQGGTLASNTDAEIAAALGYFVGKSCSYLLPNGHYLMSTFKGEQFTTTRWSSIFSQMNSQYGVTVGFACILLNPSAANITTYAPISEYIGGWSDGADPATQASTTNQAALSPGRVRAAGVKWCGHGSTQLMTPHAGTSTSGYDEAVGSGATRGSWNAIIRDNADMVQQITWNDFSEGGQLAPSVARGWGPGAIVGYYIEKWKTGTAPTIVTDTVIVSHRDQLLSATYQSGQTVLMNQTSHSVVSTPGNNVEVLTYLTAPATVSVTIGGVAQTPYTATAGEFSRLFGNVVSNSPITATVVRSAATVAQVASPFPVVANPVSQDRQYFFASSLGTTGQYYPLMSL